MGMSLSQIYESVEARKNGELCYNDYLIVVQSLEWKYKDNTLTESLETETDLVYYVEALKSNQNNLNEWNLADLSKAVAAAKAKAKAVGNSVLAHASDMVEKFKKTYAATYESFVELANKLNLGMDEVFNTFKEKGMWEGVKAAKNVAIETVANLYTTYKSAYDDTSKLLFGTISDSKMGHFLKSGAEKIQELVKKYPKLKYLLGPIIAYTLYYIWTKMVFKGDFIYDFDWSVQFKALLGDFDVVEIFSGQGGVELLTWFGLGVVGMFPSAAWLDGELKSIFGGWGNHALAMIVTLLIFINKKYPKLFDRPLIKAIKQKLCKRKTGPMPIERNGIANLKALALKKKVYKPCNINSCSG